MSLGIFLSVEGGMREILCFDITSTKISVKLSLCEGQEAYLVHISNESVFQLTQSSFVNLPYTEFFTNELEEDSPNGPIISPIPLFGISIPTLSQFRICAEDSDRAGNLAFFEHDLYFLSPPTVCNGYLLSAFWLHKKFWGGVQLSGKGYRLKIPSVMGPNGIPVTWQEIRAIPLPDDSLIGFSINKCKVSEDEKARFVSDFFHLDNESKL